MQLQFALDLHFPPKIVHPFQDFFTDFFFPKKCPEKPVICEKSIKPYERKNFQSAKGWSRETIFLFKIGYITAIELTVSFHAAFRQFIAKSLRISRNSKDF